MDLTQNHHYRQEEVGSWPLVQPKLTSLDKSLRAETALFAKLSVEERKDLRASIPSDTGWTIMTFAKRSSVFALREESPETFRAALRSLAMIKGSKFDPRDVLSRLGPLQFTCLRLGLDPGEEFQNAAKLADAKMSGFMLRFVELRDLTALEKSWCFKEIVTEDGIGFVDSENKPYAPDEDLIEVAKRHASIVEDDARYSSTDFTIATRMPNTWLDQTKSPFLDETLSRVTGCITLRAEMDRKAHPDAKDQSFIVFTMELETEADAKELLLMAKNQTSRFSMLGVRDERIVSVIIARSYVKEVEAVEDLAALKRFEKPFRVAMGSRS